VVRWYRGSVEYALIRCGSLLIVVCDVSGKGLDAALLVAALLGGLSIDPEREPFVLLRDLNNAVCGHTGGLRKGHCLDQMDRDAQGIRQD
jgi:serine phosphatase RsbU (regulator of sigma subunit)